MNKFGNRRTANVYASHGCRNVKKDKELKR